MEEEKGGNEYGDVEEVGGEGRGFEEDSPSIVSSSLLVVASSC
jgi:hypothetical protein